MVKRIVNGIELIKENCIGKLLEIFSDIEIVKEINGKNILILKIDIIQSKFTKKCIICHRDFEKSRKQKCNKCFYIYKCKNCNKLFISDKPKSIMCSNQCSLEFRSKPKYCEICKKVTQRSSNGLCSKCYVKTKSEPKYCNKCEKVTNRNSFGMCVKCMIKEMVKTKYCEKCKEITKTNISGSCVKCMMKEKTKPKYCETCSKITNRNAFGKCIICASKEKTKPKYCEKCKEITKRDAFGKCIICQTKEKTKPKYCKTCNQITKRDAVGNCIICSPREGFHQEYCNNCEKETLHNGNRCFICQPWESGFNFDRDKFYALSLSLVNFESINKIITIKDIDKYNKIPGVWSIECSNGECLEVCETQDIGKEMKLGLRCINKGYQNINKTDEELEILYKRPSKYKKYKNITKYVKENNIQIIFKLIIKNIIEKEKRFSIERQYAHDNLAKFWSPAPGQNIKIEE